MRSKVLGCLASLTLVGVLAGSYGCATSPTDTDADGNEMPMDASKPDVTTEADSGMTSPGSDTGTGIGFGTDSGGSASDTGSAGDTGEATDSGAGTDDASGDAEDAHATDGAAGDGGAEDGSTDAGTHDGSSDAAADAGHPTDAETDAHLDAGTDATSSDGGTDSASDSGTIDSGAADTGTLDAGTDATRPTDGGSDAEQDSGEDTGSCVLAVSTLGPIDAGTCPSPTNNSCNPANVSAFTPAMTPPTGMYQDLCTQSQLTTLYNDCFGTNASASKCTNFQNGSSTAACYSCVITNETDPAWGPIVQTPNGIDEVNIGGCIALLEPCNVACATAVETAFQCEVDACDNNCAFDSVNAYDTCSIKADGCGCQLYADPAQCTANLTAPHPSAECVNQTSFQGYYNVMAPLFCGPP